jgi:hypothetical protein
MQYQQQPGQHLQNHDSDKGIKTLLIVPWWVVLTTHHNCCCSLWLYATANGMLCMLPEYCNSRSSTLKQ